MSTALHTPSHSPSSSQDYLSFHTCLQDMRDPSFPSPLSPCPRVSASTPRKQPLLLTPSPLRRHADRSYDFGSAMHMDFDDFSAATGISTPFHSAAKFTSTARGSRFKADDALPPFFKPPKPQPEEDAEGLFLRSNVGHTSLPLRTPERLTFDPTDITNSVSNYNFSHAPKRKINRLSSSPNAKRGLTPLHIHHASEEGESKKLFATLAPLPAPRFLREKTSAANNMGRHVNTLKDMRISDRVMGLDSESGSDEEFSSLKVRRTTNRSVRPSNPGTKQAAPVSLDGRVNWRRTRSRPISLEIPNTATPVTSSPRPKTRPFHKRTGSNTSISEEGSPIKVAKALEKRRPDFDRRLASSATLFFGPAIVNPEEVKTTQLGMDRGSSDTAGPPSTPLKLDETSFNAASSDSSFTSAFPKPADTSIQFSFSLTSDAPSPRSRLPTKFKKPRDSGVVLTDDEMGDVLQPILEQPYPARTETRQHVHARASTFPKPSESTTMSSEETLFDESFITPSHEKARDSSWQNSSLDVSLVDDFIVKTLEAGGKDAAAADKRPPGTPQKRNKTAFLGIPIHRPWQSAAVNKMDRTSLFGERLPGPNFGSVVDNGGSAGDLCVPKRGTGLQGRPRKSCPSDLRFPRDDDILASSAMSLKSASSTTSDNETSPTDTRLVNPRNRTYGDVGLGRPGARPNASLSLIRRSSSGAFSTISDGSEGSGTGTPTRGASTTRKDNEFRAPVIPLRPICTASNRSSEVMPYSSKLSPASDETSVGRQSIRSQLSIFGKRMKENRRPDSMYNMGSHSEIPVKGRSNNFATPPINKTRQREQKGGALGSFSRPSPIVPQPREELGRFEREFVEVDKIGSGEFGSAIKVHYKGENREDRVYAVKKSKRFEGSRHRLRLREEVEILQHLSACSGPGFHPNVLGYVDSWEQDDQLYILTELCDFGNFAHFLDEYGHHFERLEEARAWKIFADISSGLQFIHAANVVHFDLKPANVFITAAGRFKIGDFGMASFWPRPPSSIGGSDMEAKDHGHNINFEREGDKMYLAAEVLQGRYGKETDIFSFGMMMLETATNICVPTQGEPWHRLRDEDFSQVEGFAECSSALQQLVMSMMSKDTSARPSVEDVYAHSVVSRARTYMATLLDELRSQGESHPEVLFKASPLAGVEDSFLSDILGVPDAMAMDCGA